MAKEFKDWVDEFVEHGANPKNVVKWPEEAGGSGTKVVSELPQVGEEHTIYELHTTIPQKFNYVPYMNEMEFRYVFENEEAFRDFVSNFATHYTNHNEFYCYCLAEDELIRVYYNSGSAYWTLFDNEEENVFMDNNERLCICKALIDENTALLLNGKQVPIGDSGGILYSPILIHQVKSKVLCHEYKFGMVFPISNSAFPPCVDGVPSVLFMSNDFSAFCTDPNSGIVQWVTNDGSIKVSLPYVDGKYRYDQTERSFYDSKTGALYNGEFEWVNIEDFNFKDYVDYETYDSIPLSEGRMNKPFIFDPSEKSITSYWIYANNEWINVDETLKFETQEKTISPSTETQEVTPDEGYDGLSKVTVDAVTSAIDSNIEAGNIKKNVTILGVNGTCEGVTYNVTKSKAYFPENLASMGVAQIGSNVYLFGGSSTNGAITRIYKFNAETETISQLSTTLPQALHRMGVAQIGSNVYLFGGVGDSNDVNTIYKFDTDTETISALSVTLPRALSGIGVAQIGNNVYLFGGHREANALDTIYKFNAETETISKLSVILPRALSGIGVAQIGNNVYLFGGNLTNGANVNDIYKFDTNTETIDVLSVTLPRLLYGMGVATFGSNVYLFGGISDTKAVNTIYKFNTETGRISTLSTILPKASFNMGVAQIGSNVYLFGGLLSSISKLHDIYKFNVNF